MKTVVVLGEAMVELRDDGDCLHRGVGGDTFNLAVYLARTGEAEVRFVSALGDDPLSDEIVHVARSEHVDVDAVARVHGARPGLYLVRTDASGERSFDYWRGESAARRMLDDPDGVATVTAAAVDADWFAYSGITVAILPIAARARLETIVTEARARGTRVVFDPNVRPSLWESAAVARESCARAIGAADVVLASADDGAHLFGTRSAEQAAERVVAFGCPEVVVTNGSAPATVRSPEWNGTVAPVAVAAIDSTAAGDAFDAGYLGARLSAVVPEEAAARGHRLARQVVMGAGALVPNRDQAHPEP